MTCKTCGSPLNGNEKFCRYCGTTVPQSAVPQQGEPVQPRPSAAPQQAPVFTPTYTPSSSAAPNPINISSGHTSRQAPAPQSAQPTGGAYAKPAAPRQPRKGPKKGLLIGGGVVAGLLVVALIVVLIIGTNPTLKVGTAFKNTADSFAKMGEVWALEEAAAIGRQEAMSLSAEVRINSVNEYVEYNDLMPGSSIRADLDVDLEEREMGMLASVYLSNVEFLTAMVSAEDEMVYVGIPDFLDDFYGINTETVMADLDAMGAGLGEAASISFNIFDMLEIVRDYSGDPEELEQAMTEAVAELVQEITVEKGDKKSLKVGGETVKCQGYTVTIPQEALEDLLSAMIDATETDPLEMMEKLYRSMSLPEDIVEELMYEMSRSYVPTDYSQISEFLEILGDVELQVYVKSSRIAGIVYEGDIEGTEMEIGLFIGGDNYGDSLTLEIKADGEKLTVKSEGDHSARDGVFTDKTTGKFTGSDDKLTLHTEYDPESGDLSLSYGDGYNEIDVEGTYSVSDGTFLLELDRIGMASGGEELMDLGLTYEVGGYERRVTVSGARMLSDLTVDDIMDLEEELTGNAYEWVMELVTAVPELAYYLY